MLRVLVFAMDGTLYNGNSYDERMVWMCSPYLQSTLDQAKDTAGNLLWEFKDDIGNLRIVDRETGEVKAWWSRDNREGL